MFKAFLCLILVILALLVCVLAPYHKCKKGHFETFHHPMWTQMIITSTKPLIMTPIIHPAYDSDDWVCDEQCSDNDMDKACK